MRTIWKFTLGLSDTQQVAMPMGATILHCADQYGELCIWAEVDADRPQILRGVAIAGTGHPLPRDPGDYIGTVIQGQFVWHIYIELEATR